MSILSWLLGADLDELLDELKRIREAQEKIAAALERISPPGFVDVRKKSADIYKPRTFQSEK